MNTAISIAEAPDDPVHKLAVVEVGFPDKTTGVVSFTTRLGLAFAWLAMWAKTSKLRRSAP